MKITLDLDELLKSGDLTEAECEKLRRLSAKSTSTLAFNILVGFGIIAVSGAALALMPSPTTAALLGLAVLAAGLLLNWSRLGEWKLLATICIIVGALMAGSALIVADDGSQASRLTVALSFAAVAVVARSNLMAVLATLLSASCLGAQGDYWHASYGLEIRKPLYTVIVYAILAAGFYRASAFLPAAYRKLSETVARTSVFLVNLGFWVGSLFGDNLRGGSYGLDGKAGPLITPGMFAMLWGLALCAVAARAWQKDRRWVLNTAAIFLAINLYTQWFEYLDVKPATVLAAGLLALAIALGLRFANGKMNAPAGPH